MPPASPSSRELRESQEAREPGGRAATAARLWGPDPFGFCLRLSTNSLIATPSDSPVGSHAGPRCRQGGPRPAPRQTDLGLRHRKTWPRQSGRGVSSRSRPGEAESFGVSAFQCKLVILSDALPVDSIASAGAAARLPRPPGSSSVYTDREPLADSATAAPRHQMSPQDRRCWPLRHRCCCRPFQVGQKWSAPSVTHQKRQRSRPSARPQQTRFLPAGAASSGLKSKAERSRIQGPSLEGCLGSKCKGKGGGAAFEFDGADIACLSGGDRLKSAPRWRDFFGRRCRGFGAD